MPSIEILESESPDVSSADVSAIVDATAPSGIRVDQVNAGPVRSLQGDGLEIDLATGAPAFAVFTDGTLAVRFEHTLRIANRLGEEEDGEKTAGSEPTTITVVHVFDFECTRDIQVTTPQITAWIETNVYFLAYPYVRQFFTTITASMGLPAVVLGYLKRSERPMAEALTDQDVNNDSE
ncbi:MAG: hypothetical protein QM774_11190 [Gordonia sp. (in: high G+C Gram-positive bacteria)]|uniref:hypothetical protein n=1 Tax=Gordonia sp. (in: high G+C Gram-positive bacteria) TaxID=84139 RepID=UPI0039E6802E